MPQTFHIFMSHLHWDHIMGLPFFVPAFIPGNRVVIYGGHADLEAALRRQQEQPSFPVDFSIFGATMEFVRLEPGRTHEVAGMAVTLDAAAPRRRLVRLPLRGAAASRRVLDRLRAPAGADPSTPSASCDFFRDADLVIFDAMYSLADAISVKADWGHSSNIVGVELCQMARRAAPVPVPPRAGLRRRRASTRVLAETRRLEEITRGERAAAGQRGLRRDGNRRCDARAPAQRRRRRLARGRIALRRRSPDVCWRWRC